MKLYYNIISFKFTIWYVSVIFSSLVCIQTPQIVGIKITEECKKMRDMLLKIEKLK